MAARLVEPRAPARCGGPLLQALLRDGSRPSSPLRAAGACRALPRMHQRRWLQSAGGEAAERPPQTADLGREGAGGGEGAAAHAPVMLEQVVQAFAFDGPATTPEDSEEAWTFVDCTVGAGGHSAAVLEAGARAGRRVRLVGVDQDDTALALAEERLRPLAAAGGHELRFVRGNFSAVGTLVAEEAAVGWQAVDGMLADLGVSSMQLDVAERGFSFRQDAPLDMRMDRRQQLSAWHVVNEFPESVLGEVLRGFGEVRNSAVLARTIARARGKAPIDTTQQLIEAMAPALHWAGKKRRWHHPATLPFQAIRMAVNDELAALKGLLESAPALLRPGSGKLALLSFHGLEDRMVKKAFKSDPRLLATTKRPLAPSVEQCEANPRCRSAKLRIAVAS